MVLTVIRVKVLVSQSCLILCDPTDCSPPGSSVHGIWFFWIVAFELWCWKRLLKVPWTARRSTLNIHQKEWYWSSNSLATWCEELTHWKRPWCWERLRAGGEGDNRGWDGWTASPTQWTWVWVDSGSWWWTRKPGVLWFMGSQRVGHDWATELNWEYLTWGTFTIYFFFF